MTNDDRNEEPEVIYEISEAESLSEGIVHAVSTASGVDPVPETHPDATGDEALDPLFTVVDPDALESVFQPRRSNGNGCCDRVTFCYCGYEVTVRRTGRISVAPLDSPAGKAST